MNPAGLIDFQNKLGITFNDDQFLVTALTHRSASNEMDIHVHNERLEFLGDAILGMVIAETLYRELPQKPEGELARIKSIVVSERTLSDIGFALGVDSLLILGKGEELSGGRTKRALIADAMEALFAAVYLDQGFEAAKKLILTLLHPGIEKVLQNKHHHDYKSLLQIVSQKLYKTIPVYVIKSKTGPDHDRTYSIACVFNGKEFSPASGKTKKEAEQKAAELAYHALIKKGGKLARELTEGMK